ncbi:MAG: phosphoribosylformylglycinamidine cyclo-ligase [Candidatus Omnitrophota bacterium]|nr:MAG: phosphoribosylformylglycinamidine cyclo-ligase [Candidatus Omnitrophota bacterium]
MDYQSAGVDIRKGERFVEVIKRINRERRGVLKGIGGFNALVSLPKEINHPVLVSATDGVGTKVKLSSLLGKHRTIGVDLVAMCVNDVLCAGAKPLFFLDYLSVGRLELKQAKEIVQGIVEGCEEAGCSLVGGETAQMPALYKEGEYDLAGFCVGIVERKRIIEGSRIRSGDKIIGIASNGLHSNGFSLIRKIFTPEELKKNAQEFLKPTRIYVKPILSLLNKIKDAHLIIKGIAHITGGGFANIDRVIPPDLSPRIEKNSWEIPWIFKEIQRRGVEEKEMFRVFNMGIGMVLVVRKKEAGSIQRDLERKGLKNWVIGEVIAKV